MGPESSNSLPLSSPTNCKMLYDVFLHLWLGYPLERNWDNLIAFGTQNVHRMLDVVRCFCIFLRYLLKKQWRKLFGTWCLPHAHLSSDKDMVYPKHLPTTPGQIELGAPVRVVIVFSASLRTWQTNRTCVVGEQCYFFLCLFFWREYTTQFFLEPITNIRIPFLTDRYGM